MADYQTLRTTMVDTQIRPSDVTRFPVIDAFLKVPRELFVPASRRDAAYAGENIEIGEGRVVLDPRTLAKMIELLDVEPHELVLDIGTGFGYSAAILSHLAEAVVAVEDDATFRSEAEAALAEAEALNVAVVEGALAEGAPMHGPYDAIILQGAVETLPDAIADQLKDDGRIVALFQEGRLGVCRIGLKSGGAISWRHGFNAGAPVLPSFEARRAFAL
ncbi:MAG: protein-L-isoaspartate O-methyltransferase [Paracoccaceae bacterium]|nr:protein-L-isoaspartate O-methyltransferase [Paracoccaceae bacterium]